MRRQGRELLAIFTDFREFLLRIEVAKHEISPRIRAGISLGMIGMFAVMAALFRGNQYLLSALLIVSAVLFFICRASAALRSCRKLVSFWLIYSTLFAWTAVELLPLGQSGFDGAIAYVLFTILYTFLWLILAGAADHSPVKMGCEIVNTITTILLIVINVFTVWAGRSLALPGAFSGLWGMAQYYSTIILLPLVVAGYLAALLKSIQIYQSQAANT